MKYEEDLKNSLRVLNEGGVILYPTETIWGLGCDATNNEATERIFKIKNRIESSSLIVLVDGEMMLRRYIRELPSAASTILGVADTPITIIYPGNFNIYYSAKGIVPINGYCFCGTCY